MHRNIVRAYNCLQDEHHRIRIASVKILSRNDKAIERAKVGWGGWTRTNTVLINSEVSYQLDHAPAVPRL